MDRSVPYPFLCPFFDFSILRNDSKLHALHSNWNISITHSHREFQRTNGSLSSNCSFFFCISPLRIVWLCDTEPAGALAILFSLYYAFSRTYWFIRTLNHLIFAASHTRDTGAKDRGAGNGERRECKIGYIWLGLWLYGQFPAGRHFCTCNRDGDACKKKQAARTGLYDTKK